MTIYLDHNATTPLKYTIWELLYSSPERLCSPINPSSIHHLGRRGKKILEESREKVAKAFQVQNPENIFFTSSASESINTAIKGSFFASQGKEFHLITLKTEHDACLKAAQFVEKKGAQIHYLAVDREGDFSLEELKVLIRKLRAKDKNLVILFSLMVANNETGKLYPIEAAAEICRSYSVPFHVDAAQVAGKLESPISLSGASMLSMSSHKMGGPQGVAALYVEQGLDLEPLLHGGGQERKRRASTSNLWGIMGFSLAAELLEKSSPLSIKKLRDSMEKDLRLRIPGMHIVCEKKKRLVNTSNMLFSGVLGQSLLINLDLEGIAVSSGAACSSGTTNPSSVLLAMGYSKEESLSSIRVSLGESNSQEEVDRFCSILPAIVQRMRG